VIIEFDTGLSDFSTATGINLRLDLVSRDTENATTFNVYGVADGTALEDFDETTLTHDSSDAFSTDFLPTDTYPLGIDTSVTNGFFYDADNNGADVIATFQLGTWTAGDTVNISSAAMLDFAQASTNSTLTFVVVSETVASASYFASKENTTYDAPTLYIQGAESGGAYDSWAASYGLSVSDKNVDEEPDGLDNLMEYALGGNPTNDDAAAVSPGFYLAAEDGTNWFHHVHNERTDETNLTYTVQLNTNLVSNDWKTNGVDFIGEAAFSNHWKTVTNRIEATPDARFIKLEVTR
jgi:hypothetical protein